MSSSQANTATTDLFAAARSYDQSINWDARLGREIPVIREVLGDPGDGGVVDAGCGTGHQALALAQAGYNVVGADMSEQMLAIARDRAASDEEDRIQFVQTPYAALREKVGPDHDGLYCLGNALAAAGTREAVVEAIGQFGQCLRSGGKLFVQILNFKPMCEEVPCVRGPRVSRSDGIEYVSVREFHRDGERLQVTNISLWHEDNGWCKRVNSGYLYPIMPEEMRTLLEENQFVVHHFWGGYDRLPFEVSTSVDLIVVATRR